MQYLLPHRSLHSHLPSSWQKNSPAPLLGFKIKYLTLITSQVDGSKMITRILKTVKGRYPSCKIPFLAAQ